MRTVYDESKRFTGDYDNTVGDLLNWIKENDIPEDASLCVCGDSYITFHYSSEDNLVNLDNTDCDGAY